jgi:DNA mismatch repair protein MutL
METTEGVGIGIIPRKVLLLDPHTVNQIAAGEVVERPASVVKELVENALDAGATRVQIELVDSGRTLIRVTDDGSGMSPEDARACLQRHATSKITAVEDLLQVRSLGFRGEAVPSIASVSKFTLSTGNDDTGRTVLRLDGGTLVSETRAAGPRGTDVWVEDLFFNTPARLKFLKSDSTELSAMLEHVMRYAMAFPHVAFSVTHNNQVALTTTGSGDLHATIAEVWGRDTARGIAEVSLQHPGIRVSGFVSPPHMTRPTRAYQYLYVNGRPVRSRTLYAALDQSYRDLTPEKRYPVVVLLLDVDPEKVDVNVSPTKSEVKFQREGEAFDSIRTAVRAALMEHGMMPDAAGIAAANEALRWTTSPIGSPELSQLSMLAQSPFGEAAHPTPNPLPIGHEPSRQGGGSERYPFIELLEGLRVLGQAMKTFIIAETARGIVIIDQHVAHERVLYEYLCGLKGPSAIEKQALLAPETLHLNRAAALILRERLEEIVAVGFDIEPFGGESFVVRAAPAALRGKSPLKVLQDMVDELVDGAVSRKLTPTREQIWITSSCKMAVKAGDALSHAEMEKLIVDLASTENPYLCPHGRPITITLGRDDLLRKFYRH